MRTLRIFLRNIVTLLAQDKRFKEFTRPVDIEQARVLKYWKFKCQLSVFEKKIFFSKIFKILRFSQKFKSLKSYGNIHSFGKFEELFRFWRNLRNLFSTLVILRRFAKLIIWRQFSKFLDFQINHKLFYNRKKVSRCSRIFKIWRLSYKKCHFFFSNFRHFPNSRPSSGLFWCNWKSNGPFDNYVQNRYAWIPNRKRYASRSRSNLFPIWGVFFFNFLNNA